MLLLYDHCITLDKEVRSPVLRVFYHLNSRRLDRVDLDVRQAYTYDIPLYPLMDILQSPMAFAKGYIPPKSLRSYFTHHVRKNHVSSSQRAK
jgi:hypothetical protein